MWQTTWRVIAFTCAIFIVRPLFASPSNDEVASWAGNVLMITVTANYKDFQGHAQRKTYIKYYSGQAVSGLSQFFSELKPIMIQNKLSTNPQPMGPPEVINQGKMNGINSWKVTQTYNLTSLNRKVWFSVVVIENDDPPLLIESLNMTFFD